MSLRTTRALSVLKEVYYTKNRSSSSMSYQIELRGISKRFGTHQALKSVNFSAFSGSIHALLGENGAGKSTLLNILYGILRADAGEIFWEGEQKIIKNPIDAKRLGIGIVFQHFALFDVMSVTENVALGMHYKGNLKALKTAIEEVSDVYQLRLCPDSLIADLSTGEKQRVEIIRCLLQHPKLIILDEPTSVLTPIETKHLFQTLATLRDKGCCIVFVSHKLDEVKALCDRATILRQGELIASHIRVDGISSADMALKMVGTHTVPYHGREEHTDRKTLMRVDTFESDTDDTTTINLSTPMQINTYETLGIAGISGNGQEYLSNFLSGEITTKAENIIYKDHPCGQDDVTKRRHKGILLVPTDRLDRSAIPQMSILENTLIGIRDKRDFVHKSGIIKEKRLNDFCDRILADFGVVPNDKKALSGSLSGGNLQKFIMGRTIYSLPELMIVYNPTWGVDINGSRFIRNEILKLRNKGVAVVLISEDLEEIFSISDRIRVLSNYELSKPIKTQETSIEEIGRLMTHV